MKSKSKTRETDTWFFRFLSKPYQISNRFTFRMNIIHQIILLMAPVAVIFACCATPSPKFLVENAVSPSGIIHAAKSGTRFRHFNATMLAAIRYPA